MPSQFAGSTIFFSGCDLVDGTPILDVKPYIPAYDSPWCVGQDEPDEGDDLSESGPLREAAGEELPMPSSSLSQQHTPTKSISMREEPDGEEQVPGAVGGVSKQTSSTPTTTVEGAEPTVRVPSWIEQPPVMRLNVRYVFLILF
jgi:tRNA-methyltransferase O